jgi:signal transduction histidine kinase
MDGERDGRGSGHEAREGRAIVPAAPEAAASYTSPPPEPGSDLPALPAILLVDDRPENLLALEAVLEPLGVRLVRATSADEALRHVEAEAELALILLDVQMPGTDGLEAARLIKTRERGQAVPILFVTALDHDRRRVTTAYQAGAVDYLFKPLDPDELRAKVAAFLDLHRLHGEDRERRRRYADRLVHSSEARYLAAAEEAEHARTAMEAADRAKDEFLARMSHELRTPLNAILGYIQLLDLGILGTVTPEQHTHLNRVRQSAVHLLSLVNEILDLVTLDAAGVGLRVEHEVGHVGEVCEAALALVRIEAATRNLTVAAPAADGPGATYVGDPHRVRQVLVHLLTNALKFTPSGGRVTVTCGTADTVEPDAEANALPYVPGPGPWAYVRVTDTGIGIAPNDVRRIFDPFTQVDGGRTRAEGGAGLGLTISRRLARAMGGEVTVRSQPNQGSAFTLWLPAPRAAGRIAPRAEPEAARATPRDGADGAPPTASATWYPALAALGSALASEVEALMRQHVVRLRADRSLPNVRTLPEAQLRDHTGTLVGEIAYVLTVTGQTEGRAPELLHDGGEILRVVAELHGAQRQRLGWSEAHVGLEIEHLRDEIAAVLARAAAQERADGEALAEAGDLVARLLEQSRQTSLRGFHDAERVGAT